MTVRGFYHSSGKQLITKIILEKKIYFWEKLFKTVIYIINDKWQRNRTEWIVYNIQLLLEDSIYHISTWALHKKFQTILNVTILDGNNKVKKKCEKSGIKTI